MISSLAKRHTKIMGVDCSTHSFAYSIFHDGQPVRCGEIPFSTGDLTDRIGSAQKLIQQAIDDGTLDATAVAFERAVMVNRNAQTGMHLAYVYGATIAPLINSGMTVRLVEPTTWQNFIGNKTLSKAEKELIKAQNPGKSESWYKNAGREFRKQRTLTIARKYFATIENDSDNIGDAIGVGLWGIDHYSKS